MDLIKILKATLSGLILLGLMILIGPIFIEQPAIRQLDEFIYKQTQLPFSFPELIPLFKILTHLGSTPSFIFLSFLMVFQVYRKFGVQSALILALGCLEISFGNWGIKQFVARMRPDSEIITVTGFSFPSGHAAHISFLMILFYDFASAIKSGFNRRITKLVFVFAALAVGLSRIVLQVHWTSDVAAGFFLGSLMGILVCSSFAQAD